MRTITRQIAGAFIFSNDGFIVLGKSNTGLYEGKWLVPGGGFEKGETALQAAVRETYEEVGVDISKAAIEAFDPPLNGVSEKVLKDTGERVVVEMQFHDFWVYLDKPARDILLVSSDDMSMAAWHAVNSLPTLPISPAMETRLRQLGYYK